MRDFLSGERAKVTRDDASVLAALREISAASKRDTKAGRRWIHPFPAKMPATVPQLAIQRLLDKNGVILDPFSGSGTMSHAAQIEGRKSVGVVPEATADDERAVLLDALAADAEEDGE